MRRVRVKICGITSLKDLLITVEAGVDAVGFVVNVPSSPRNLSINDAKELIKATPVFVETVAVTVQEDLNYLVEIYEELNPDVLQVHGFSHRHNEIRERLPDAPLMGAFQAKSNNSINTIIEAASTFDAVLLDTHVSGKHGGTGKTHDWKISKRVREAIYPKPLILAGGLKPENIKEAISVVKPYAVDVSSGVESYPGKKDREKVSEFIKKAMEVEI